MDPQLFTEEPVRWHVLQCPTCGRTKRLPTGAECRTAHPPTPMKRINGTCDDSPDIDVHIVA